MPWPPTWPARHGVAVRYLQADMSNADECRALVNTAGGCDILVNNAGIQHVAKIEDFPVDKWNAILAINLSSAFHTTAAALPGMYARGWGRVVNIASAHGSDRQRRSSRPMSRPSTASSA